MRRCALLIRRLNNLTLGSLVWIALGCISATANAGDTIRSTDLQALCSELRKGELGGKFDHEAAAKCQGYLVGFFDTMIILEKMKKYQYFCIPSSVPKESNTRILDTWIESNIKIAKDTTASVALLSAYQKAFPCPGQQKKPK
jgi:hypothetical protein